MSPVPNDEPIPYRNGGITSLGVYCSQYLDTGSPHIRQSAFAYKSSPGSGGLKIQVTK
jgi:hypothetical protein